MSFGVVNNVRKVRGAVVRSRLYRRLVKEVASECRRVSALNP